MTRAFWWLVAGGSLLGLAGAVFVLFVCLLLAAARGELDFVKREGD